MKAVGISLAMTQAPHFNDLVYLTARGIQLTKKVFVRPEPPAGQMYLQAETPQEDRALRLAGFPSFFLGQEKAVSGGTYR